MGSRADRARKYRRHGGYYRASWGCAGKCHEGHVFNVPDARVDVVARERVTQLREAFRGDLTPKAEGRDGADPTDAGFRLRVAA